MKRIDTYYKSEVNELLHFVKPLFRKLNECLNLNNLLETLENIYRFIFILMYDISKSRVSQYCWQINKADFKCKCSVDLDKPCITTSTDYKCMIIEMMADCRYTKMP